MAKREFSWIVGNALEMEIAKDARTAEKIVFVCMADCSDRRFQRELSIR